ncbi:dynactin subunit 6 [Maniola hyperantus]|uniref:dynactin subunit 6 n=1 Tax=Aphantopus hyperantus TaxID=2795564 RepID=UPI00156857B3|nr:dynactin subunit 6 [Maniola hyperantus]
MSQNIKILPGATVCEDCTLEGDITIGGGTVIHPRVTIIAEGGPIIIAEYCIIEEYSTIIHKKSDKQENPPKPLFIGAHNVFEVGCKLESPFGHVGENNVFECKSYVGVDVKVGSGCVIGAACRLTVPQSLQDNTVIWGSEHHNREALEKQPSQLLQLDFLSKVMPNYHRLRKPNLHKRQPSRQSQEVAKV